MMKHIFLFSSPEPSLVSTTEPQIHQKRWGISLKIGYLGGSRSSCPMFAPVPIFWHRFRSHCCSSSTSRSTGPSLLVFISRPCYRPTTRLLVHSILFRHFHQHFQHFLRHDDERIARFRKMLIAFEIGAPKNRRPSFSENKKMNEMSHLFERKSNLKNGLVFVCNMSASLSGMLPPFLYDFLFGYVFACKNV